MSLNLVIPSRGAGEVLPAASVRSPSALVDRLAEALDIAGVRCCQWKGHVKRARWATGEGDIDLLIDRADAATFAMVIDQLAFKLALPQSGPQPPGVLSYFGFDPDLERLIHVHAHYRIVIGAAHRRQYVLAIERAVLDSACRSSAFPTPTPEFELLLFVVRQTLRHDPRDLLQGGEPRWLAATRAELAHLEGAVAASLVRSLLARHLPEIGAPLFARCLDSLRAGVSPWRRLATRRALERRLGAFVHPGPGRSLVARAVRRARASATASARRLGSGGAVIALVGTDGAGKSTCARSLHAWLGREFLSCHAHLGRPPRSPLTLLAGGALKLAELLPGGARRSKLAAHVELLRYVCTARDRHRLYRRVRRVSALGGIAICERYPIPETAPLVGATVARGIATGARSRLATALRALESGYYARVALPDLVLVLRVDPETAVRRKVDEPEPYVRRRARLLWDVDWSPRGAVVVDATRPLPDVMAALRAHVWRAL
jgi:thymidylate kinase